MKLESDSAAVVTPFAKAGIFSRMTFWWVNPLMKRGREKNLEDEDIPKLRETDRAENCHLLFLEQLSKQQKSGPSSRPSIRKALILCYWKEIFLTGCFALLNILALCAGPVLLNAFILVAEGKKSFKYEGHVLAISFFFSKSIASISQRQWYFRCRLIGLKVRSLLIAAIYKKQLRLSNSARMVHSGGEIMNYVTVDAYRMGEFPFWFHQIWTTGLQLLIALAIVFHAVRLATIAAVAAIILTVLCSIPLAKLQHKFQSKLIAVQDERLKASSEALVNMKILKLYAWENHFKNVIENLRKVEYRWLSGVQLEKAYHSLLFWIQLHLFPMLLGCSFKRRLHLHALQNSWRLQSCREKYSAKLQRERDSNSISIKSADFTWEDKSSNPTLRNINLEVRAGEKVAICGEVGSGKSTLLSAILGEVPKIQGSIKISGKISYVSQIAWIQNGTIQENILFGSAMDSERYGEILEKCSLVKDLELLPYGDLTEIGERGVNLSGGQKQRLMSDGKILQEGPYHRLLASSKEFQDLVNAHKETAGSERLALLNSSHSDRCGTSSREMRKNYEEKQCKALKLLNSLFHAPMSFYDSTPLGRILSRVSSDLSTIDLDVPFGLIFTVSSTINACSSLLVLAVVTWQVLIVSIPMIFLSVRLQRYYFASAKELMRINATTKSSVANHLAESLAGAMTIRAFQKEDRFFSKSLDLIDTNASPFFHSFAANEWLIQWIEIVSATVLSSAALCMVLLPPRTFSSGFIGMALSYGLSLNNNLVRSIQKQCGIANSIISVERLNQYMHIPSEAPQIIEESRPSTDWPAVGKVEVEDLQVRYRPNTPLVLCGISCTFEGGHKIGIVGRTGSGKTTLIGALFRLVEPAAGKITVDGIDISTIGLHDLRSRLGIIPQDPTLFNGTVRYNLDPLSQYSDQEIWEVIGKSQLQEALQEKGKGLESLVVGDGSNWSVGQRQLFCLGRVLLRRSRILVLDEATASIDNATDMILQKTIRSEFADRTVIIVAHRIPTVMDCNMVLAISDGKLVEYDTPTTLMKREDSLFGQLVKEYWSHSHSTEPH
ncbi:ABC transporter C family member 10 [Morella rubra]|uniref:ABC-type xenobiotic transporter n=1 Tax=Morella rubra TaxID=262757 RepID=A0A6A1UX22_9ROSI|nr:ABC transporter C family member 10 [Morella rubra]